MVTLYSACPVFVFCLSCSSPSLSSLAPPYSFHPCLPLPSFLPALGVSRAALADSPLGLLAGVCLLVCCHIYRLSMAEGSLLLFSLDLLCHRCVVVALRAFLAIRLTLDLLCHSDRARSYAGLPLQYHCNIGSFIHCIINYNLHLNKLEYKI